MPSKLRWIGFIDNVPLKGADLVRQLETTLAFLPPKKNETTGQKILRLFPQYPSTRKRLLLMRTKVRVRRGRYWEYLRGYNMIKPRHQQGRLDIEALRRVARERERVAMEGAIFTTNPFATPPNVTTATQLPVPTARGLGWTFLDDPPLAPLTNTRIPRPARLRP